jgi:hypothetical protein
MISRGVSRRSGTVVEILESSSGSWRRQRSLRTTKQDWWREGPSVSTGIGRSGLALCPSRALLGTWLTQHSTDPRIQDAQYSFVTFAL